MSGLETPRHLYTVLGIMFKDAERYLNEARELSKHGRAQEAAEMYQKKYDTDNEAVEYLESWLEEALAHSKKSSLDLPVERMFTKKRPTSRQENLDN